MTDPKGTGIEIDVSHGFEKFSKLGVAFAPIEFTKGAGLALLEWVGRNFKAQGLESPWKPLSINTLAARRMGGRGAQILQDTGRLRQSFVPGAQENIYRTSASEVTVGTASEIAGVHEKGGRGAYTISPKSGKMLAFAVAGGFKVDRSANVGISRGTAFAKKVNHPALPQRKMLPSNSMAEKIVAEFAEAKVRQIVDKAESAS